MKQFILRHRKLATSQSVFAFLAVCVIVSISLACSFSNYLPATSSSPANINQQTASQAQPTTLNNVAPGLCQLAYFPIGAGVTRKYRVTYQSGGISPREYTESFRNVAPDSFIMHLQFADVAVDNNWRCTTDGLLATQFDNNSVKTNNGVEAKIETTRSAGITLPPDSRWRAGEKWTTDYDVKETMNLPNSSMRASGDGNVKLAGEIIGEENVTVPAGDFQAMKLRIIQKIEITVKINGAAIPVPQIPFETTVWYSKGVGMIKSTTISGGAIVATTELLSTDKR